MDLIDLPKGVIRFNSADDFLYIKLINRNRNWDQVKSIPFGDIKKCV